MAVYVDGKSDKNINIQDQLDINQEDLIVGEGLNGYISDLMIFNKSLDSSQSQAFSIYKNNYFL